MGSGMPEIGSRISLISKADIRYEGKLYSVDPEECTIALSSVRSYGTEDRKTTYPVPAQNQVYDYILFRGSDIKDIRVLTTTIPNDPAIVQLSVPPSINDLQFQSQPGYPPPSIGSLTMPNVVPGPSRGQSLPGEFQNAAGFVSQAAGTNLAHSITKPQPVPNISEDESRSSTPSTQNAVQHKNTADSNRPHNSKSDEQTQQRRPNAYQQRDNRPNQPNRYQQQKPQYQQQQQQQRYTQHQQQPQQQQQQQNPRYMQQNQRYPQQQRYMQPQYREYRDNNNQYRNQNDYRDQYVARQYPKWNNQRTGQQSNQQQQNYQSAAYQNRKPRNTLKFENEFDFEQANSQFEEVKSKLASVKIDDSVKVNGDVEAKKDSGEISGGEENDPEKDEPIFYDKVKSFFDQISYEAIERSKGHTQRLDWKTERKINSETFGPVALRRNNNYRGPRPGGNYYNNYQSNNYQGNNYQNRNLAMANKFRGGYRQKTPQTRRPYNNNEVKVNDDSKGNQSA